MPDEFCYKGERYSLVGIRGTGLFTPADFELNPYSTCSACWRGFVMKYDCVDGKLILNEMLINVKDPPSINSVEPKPGDDLFEFRYEKLNLKTKFTGTILLAKDFIRAMYVHMGFQRPMAFKTVIELRIEDGKIIVEKDLSEKMEEYRKKDLHKGAQPQSRSKEDVINWIEQTFSLDYDLD